MVSTPTKIEAYVTKSWFTETKKGNEANTFSRDANFPRGDRARAPHSEHHSDFTASDCGGGVASSYATARDEWTSRPQRKQAKDREGLRYRDMDKGHPLENRGYMERP